MRTITVLHDDWRFSRDDPSDAASVHFDDSAWDLVRVPHDWAISGPFDPENDVQVSQVLEDGETRPMVHRGRTGSLPHVGIAWYRRRFVLDEAFNGAVRLEFDGIMSHSRVYVNGRMAAERPYGYSSFCADVSDIAVTGENVLAIRVDNPPSASRWYPGAGIYRNVRLLTLSPSHVAYAGVWATTPKVSEASATVVLRQMINSAGLGAITVVATVLSPVGEQVTESTRPLDASGEVSHELRVPQPRLWSAGDPQLYTARTTILLADEVLDTVDTRFGIRSLEHRPDGFLVNGVPESLNGVCLHHDLGPLGAAVNRAAIARQLRVLKQMGCNAIRTSHNPPAPELLELCDEIGFYVIDEAFDEWQIAKVDNGYHREFDDWAERDLVDLIHRDRNHPCVVMWSVGNEVREQSSSAGAEIATWLSDICHREDPTRPSTAAFNDLDEAIQNGLADAVDVPGWNYKPHRYASVRAEHADWPMLGSETASCISSRGEYYLPVDEEKPPNRENLQVNSYDLATTPWATTPDQEFSGLDENPSVMGEFVWTGFDYLGEPTPYNEYHSRSSYFGIVDLAGIPKSRYWLYKSRWSTDPVLYIHPHWTWDHEGQLVPVHCYTNYPQVELFVNGRSQARRIKQATTLLNRHRLVWPGVAYEPGELRAVGYDHQGLPVGEFVVRTAGDPDALSLVCDRSQIYADSEDMAFITVGVVDAAGTIVPNSQATITVTAEGAAEIVAVCNGDPTDYTSFQSASMKAFHGQCVVYLRATRETGRAVVTAQAGGVKPASIAIETLPVS